MGPGAPGRRRWSCISVATFTARNFRSLRAMLLLRDGDFDAVAFMSSRRFAKALVRRCWRARLTSATGTCGHGICAFSDDVQGTRVITLAAAMGVAGQICSAIVREGLRKA